MYNPYNPDEVGPELGGYLAHINENAVNELKRRIAQEGRRIVETRRLYNATGEISLPAIAEQLKAGLLTNLEARRARDYADIMAHDPDVIRPKVVPRDPKKPRRQFEDAR